MQVKPISAVPASGSADVEWFRTLVTSVMSVGEVAVALAASDMPTRKASLSDDQATDYAVQGLARLGVAEVQYRAERARNLNMRYVELGDLNGGTVPVDSPICKRLDRLNRELWGSDRRETRAIDVAYQVTTPSRREPQSTRPFLAAQSNRPFLTVDPDAFRKSFKNAVTLPVGLPGGM